MLFAPPTLDVYSGEIVRGGVVGKAVVKLAIREIADAGGPVVPQVAARVGRGGELGELGVDL